MTCRVFNFYIQLDTFFLTTKPRMKKNVKYKEKKNTNIIKIKKTRS